MEQSVRHLLTLTSYDTRVKSLKPRRTCTGVVLWLSDPSDMVQNIQWMFVLHRLEWNHKTEAQASRYANIEQDCRVLNVCQWHTFSTDRSEYEDTKYGTIRKASFNLNIIL